jgi:hypothetical protein
MTNCTPAFKMLARVSKIMEQLVHAWDVLATMTPPEYSAIRPFLANSSGFQSWQYRCIEFSLGNKNKAMLQPHAHRPDLLAQVQAAYETPSLYDEALRLLARRGLAMPASHTQRDWTLPYLESAEVEAAWLLVYRQPADTLGPVPAGRRTHRPGRRLPPLALSPRDHSGTRHRLQARHRRHQRRGLPAQDARHGAVPRDLAPAHRPLGAWPLLPCLGPAWALGYRVRMKPLSLPPLDPTRWRLALLSASLPAALLLLALLAGALWAAWWALDPTPVKRLVIATGPEGSAYEEFGRRYAPLLRAQGVTVEWRATQGADENLALLQDAASAVQVAFVQGGATGQASGRAAAPADTPALASLGSVALEPLWLFYRVESLQRLQAAPAASQAAVRPQRTPPPQMASAITPDNLSQLAAWRIDIGPAGGGSAPLMQMLAAAHGLPTGQLVTSSDAAVHRVLALVQGRVDALALVSAADAPLLQYLLHTPGVQPFDFGQAQAYARRFPGLQPLLLPRGVVDLAKDQPRRDLHLVGATASLVARADLHPALVQLLLQTAHQVHGGAGWFHRGGQFPNADTDHWPLAPEAERYHRSGPPWLQRALPFWLANFVDRMWIVLLPLLAALVPLSRVVPPLVTLRLRSRVYRWYAHLRAVEQALESPHADLAQLAQELERIDAQTERIGLPLSFTNELYDLRAHIELVRKRLRARAPAAA